MYLVGQLVYGQMTPIAQNSSQEQGTWVKGEKQQRDYGQVFPGVKGPEHVSNSTLVPGVPKVDDMVHVRQNPRSSRHRQGQRVAADSPRCGTNADRDYCMPYWSQCLPLITDNANQHNQNTQRALYAMPLR